MCVDADDEQQLLLMEKNRQLQEAMTCNVCADKEVNTIFLPCGHLVSCDRCSLKLCNCPVCGTCIRGTVNSRHFSRKLNELSMQE